MPTSIDLRRSTPPFRAEHVGSLLRAPEVVQARGALKRGEITPAQLRTVEDAAVRNLVKMQEDLGLKCITDGEIRRTTWHMDFIEQIGGLAHVQADPNMKVTFHGDHGDLSFTPEGLRATERLSLGKTIFGDDFAFLKSVTRATPKITIPSPSMVHYRGGRAVLDPKVYPDMELFWTDLKRVYAEQIAGLAKLGCTYLQLDDTSLAYLNDPAQREYVAKLGGDAKNQHRTYIELMNGALASKPANMTVCTHLCRGNYRSSWASAGSYEYVAEALFNELHVDGYFLEFDDARSGGFEPLRFVPKGKYVVLGLITTKHGQLETKDEIKRRIDAAAKFIPLDQLCLSPQCGFASTVEGNDVTFANQSEKLRLVVETAREVWGD
jgi:5-methyltetrahydropteroyltriglutamate--homocysteine methyltransferase